MGQRRKTLSADRRVPISDSGHGFIFEYPVARITKLSEEHGQVDISLCAARPNWRAVVFRNSPRTCEHYFVIADGKTNRAVGMEAGASKFALVQPNASHPLLPRPVKDAVLLSAVSRYDELVNRTEAQRGKFTVESALRLMDRPVSMKSNLHNALFEPKSTRFWVGNAAADGSPAANQEYRSFQLSELLERKP